MLSKIGKTFKRLIKDERGPTLIEYGIIAALIVVVCIAVITSMGKNIKAKFEDIDDAIGG